MMTMMTMMTSIQDQDRPQMIHQDDDEDEDNAAINDVDNNDEDDKFDDEANDNKENDANNDNYKASPLAISRTLNIMKKLATSYNPYAMDYVNHHHPSDENSDDQIVHQANQFGRDEEDDEVEVIASDKQIGDPNLASLAINPLSDFAFYTKEKVVIQQTDFEEAFHHHPIKPASFDDAYYHPDPSQCKKWQEAIKKEFCNMTHCRVWCKVKRSTVPHG